MRGTVGKTTKIESRIKQLCCLGLGSEAVMPALLQELHALVPSHGNSFFWVDEHGRLSNAYDEHPAAAEIMPLYFSEFYNRREREVSHTFAEAVRLERGVLRDEHFVTVSRRDFHRSDFYNLILRPLNYHRCLRLVVRDNGRTRGFLQLQRATADKEFTDRDVHYLGRLQPFLTHAVMARRPLDNISLVENGDSGLIIADSNGKLISFSPQGRRLLFLATHPLVGSNGKALPAAGLSSSVSAICKALVSVFTNDASATAPVIRHRNSWGGFTFRAHPLEAGSPDTTRIGITITHEEPLPLRLTRATFGFQLSARQTQVAVLLASGLTHQQIADRLDLSRNTVISHSRWIYAKLGVHDAFALRSRLLENRHPALPVIQ